MILRKITTPKQTTASPHAPLFFSCRPTKGLINFSPSSVFNSTVSILLWAGLAGRHALPNPILNWVSNFADTLHCFTFITESPPRIIMVHRNLYTHRHCLVSPGQRPELIICMGCWQQWENLDWWALLPVSDCLWNQAGATRDNFRWLCAGFCLIKWSP